MSGINFKSVTPEYYKVQTKLENEHDQPSFMLIQKTDKGYSPVSKFNGFQGFLVNVENKNYVYEEDNIEYLEFTFVDEKGKVSKLSWNFNFLLYNFLNCLSSADNLSGSVQIRLFATKNKETKKLYAGLIVIVDHKKLNWKFKSDELPKPISAKVGKKDVVDYSPLNDFWKEKIISEILPKLDKSKLSTAQDELVAEDDFVEETSQTAGYYSSGDETKTYNTIEDTFVKDDDIIIDPEYACF